MENQSQPAPTTQRIEIGTHFMRNLITSAAVPLLALRPKVGFSIVNPNWLMIHLGVMLLWVKFAAATQAPTYLPLQATVSPSSGSPLSIALLLAYALTVFIVGMRRRAAAWKDMVSGVVWDGWSPGLSWLELFADKYPWVPGFLRINRRLTRWVEPFLWYIIGMFALLVSPPLGVCICFSAIALKFYEEKLWQATIQRIVDLNDARAAAGAHRELDRMMRGEVKTQSSLSDTGTPVGGNIPELLNNQQRLRRYEEEQARLRAGAGAPL